MAERDGEGPRRRNVGNGEVFNPAKYTSGMSVEQQKEINIQKIRNRACALKTEAVSQLENQLSELVDDFVNEVEQIEHPDAVDSSFYSRSGLFRNSDRESRSRDHQLHDPGSLRGKKNGELPNKEFMARKSVLTELLEISHIRTIYHIFVAILIVFSLNTIVYDLIDKGTLALDFNIISWAFGKFPIVMSLWFCMKLATVLIVYPSFSFWAHSRTSGSRIVWQDYVWLSLYILYQMALLVLPVRVLLTHQLPPASSVIIVCEQVRLMMKTHAFIRENIPRALNYNKANEEDGGQSACPDFSKYLYFLFAPTLVYRDNYPRIAGAIKWNYVVSNFGQVLACLFYTYYIFERFCVPVFRNFNSFSSSQASPRKFVLIVFGSMMPGTLVLFVGFFAILHSWLNAFAEMLRFGDRLFYKDWWNSSSFANYYRTWNVVVHDWLYSYVYKDCYKIFGKPSRVAAMTSVFMLSAVFHEYILSMSFGFFYPVLFVMFAGAGFAFIFLPKDNHRSGNVFMWVSLFMGNGLLMCLYSMEWYARQKCSSSDETLWEWLTPHSWTCAT